MYVCVYTYIECAQPCTRDATHFPLRACINIYATSALGEYISYMYACGVRSAGKHANGFGWAGDGVNGTVMEWSLCVCGSEETKDLGVV